MLGGVSVAVGVRTGGTVAAEWEGEGDMVLIEHPSGTFDVRLELEGEGPETRVRTSGVLRTARKLMDGVVWPRSGKALG